MSYEDELCGLCGMLNEQVIVGNYPRDGVDVSCVSCLGVVTCTFVVIKRQIALIAAIAVKYAIS